MKNIERKEVCGSILTIFKFKTGNFETGFNTTIQYIKEDGNCFFNCLSYFFIKTQKYDLFFRYLLYSYIKDYLTEIIKEHPLIPKAGIDYKTDKYYEKIKENSFSAGDFELSQSIYFIFII